jgi:uncharacterized damage-inducible protein DinB
MSALIETWEINQKMNELLLKNIPGEHLADTGVSKGRTVGQHMAHIHNVRLMWIKVAAPQLLELQKKIEKEDPVTGAILLEETGKSAKAISELLQVGLAAGKIKGFKPHPEAFLGYMIAHEAHHRGQAIMVLKENGHLPGRNILYGLWEWGTK